MINVSIRTDLYYVGNIYDLDRLIRILRETHGRRLQGYKYYGGKVTWGEINGISDLPLSVEDYVEPGLYRLREGYRFRHISVSPKLFLLPSKQIYIVESNDFSQAKVLDYNVSIQYVLFGIKPCDLNAINVLDRMIGEKNPVYAHRRRSISAIIVEECLEPNNNCFCGVMNSGPFVEKDFDIAYARLDDKRVIFKYGSSFGRDVLSKMELRIAGEKEVYEYLEKTKLARERTSAVFKKSMKEIQESLMNKARDKELWLKISENCIGCGNCNFVCPTCFCLEFDYSINGEDQGVKIANWTGCLLYSYGQVAGGHFRPELYTRYRHFILHKFVFYPRRIERLGCFGCGRCITWCPMSIDLCECVNNAISG
ncbi:MAG: 4Fe-4S dicluster domain-containing protein [Desulfurococcaceae archaeon]